jgi:hypothetical protein
MTKCIRGEGLAGLDVSGDGSCFHINFTKSDGSAGTLTLPSECLNSLLMTLPRVIQTALQARHRDESLRLVYPAARIDIEKSSDAAIAIMTLSTTDQFEVSFGVNKNQMKDLCDVFTRYLTDTTPPNFN